MSADDFDLDFYLNSKETNPTEIPEEELLRADEDFQEMLSGLPLMSVSKEDFDHLQQRLDRLTRDFSVHRETKRLELLEIKNVLSKTRKEVENCKSTIEAYHEFTQIIPEEIKRFNCKDLRILKSTVQHERKNMTEEIRLLKMDSITLESERGLLKLHLKVVLDTFDLLESLTPDQKLLRERFLARLRRFETYK